MVGRKNDDEAAFNGEPIAVVGIACLYPGSINLEQFWNNILTKKDLIREVPKTHWLLDDFYHPDPRAIEKSYASRSGTLPEVPFDFKEFGIPPNNIAKTDMSQLLGLVVAKTLLEDAFNGDFRDMDREKASVILGFSLSTILSSEMHLLAAKPIWLRLLREHGIAEETIKKIFDARMKFQPDFSEDTFPGILQNVIAGRIANRFDLHGTNCVIDAACASSLSAIHLAVKELQSHESNLVLTGGIQTISGPMPYLCFSRTPALSFSGQIRPFDEKADGTLLGEGVGFMALRRLSDAERDGNKIYAVIRGVGTSSDGKGKSIYAPEMSGQARALERCYDKTGYSPETVELLEAHGTGTTVGDLTELKTIKSIFSNANAEKRQWCGVGSIKSQIGHTLGAAGAASMIKTILALHHKVLPPTINVEQPTTKLDFKNSPLYISSEARPWIHSQDYPRRASVSSFGFGGTNFHVALEEYCGKAKKPERRDTFPSELFLFSGEDPSQLIQQIKPYIGQENSERSLFSLAQDSIKTFDTAKNHRLGIVAETKAALKTKIQQVIKGLEDNLDQMWLPPLGIFYDPKFKIDKIAFLFPGQGSQYLNMGSHLAMHFEAFREVWDQGNRVKFEKNRELKDIVFPIPAFTQEEKDFHQQQLTHTQWAQPAIGLTSAAMIGLLEKIGLRADMAAGHSFGEITALYHSGVFDLETFLQFSRTRGEFMAEASTVPGGMAAVSGEGAQVDSLIKDHELDVVIANYNSPKQSVISGSLSEIKRAQGAFEAAGLKVKQLNVATAFHSSLVSSSEKKCLLALEAIDLLPPQIPVFSNETATTYPHDLSQIRGHLSRHLCKPVHFFKEVQAMSRNGANLFLEVGPGSTLSRLVNESLPDQDHRAVSLDAPGKHGISALQLALAQLSALGIPLQLNILTQRNLAPRDEFEKTPTTMMISSTNHNKKYPLHEEAPEKQATSKDPWVLGLDGQGSGVNKLVSLLEKQKKELKNPQEQKATPAMAVGAEGRAFALKGSDPQNQGISPYALKSMPTPPGFHSRPKIDTGNTEASPPTSNTNPATALEAAAPIQPHTPSDSSLPKEENFSHLGDLLFEVIAEKTGYPLEIISPEMNLEADLGIDSIKRVEIFMTINEKVPNLPQVEIEQLAELQTIQQIIDFMKEAAANLGGSQIVTTSPSTSVPALTQTPKRTPTPSQISDQEKESVGTPQLTDLEAFVNYPLSEPGKELREEDIKIQRSEVRPQTLEVSTQINFSPSGELVICDDGIGVALELGKILKEAALSHRIVQEPEEIGENWQGSGIIYLKGIAPLKHFYSGTKLNKHAFQTAKYLAKWAQASQQKNGLCFIAVQDLGGDFGFSQGDRVTALRGGLAGLTKTFAKEYPGHYSKVIDIETKNRSPKEIAQAIFQEIFNGAEHSEIAISQTGARLAPQEIVSPWETEQNCPIGKDSVLVVSGGARGITAACVIELAKQFQPKIVLFGRSQVLEQEPESTRYLTTEKDLKAAIIQIFQEEGRSTNPNVIETEYRVILNSREVRQTIAALNKAGSPVKYYAVDLLESRLIRSEGPTWHWKAGSFVRTALAEVRQDWGPITALIHGAGVIQDKMILDKTQKQFDLVFDTKVAGLEELLNALESDPLNTILLFSSVAARYGNRGQSDYAMANEAINKIAQAEKRKRGSDCLVKSINWGPWDGGMISGFFGKQIKAMGIPLISISQGSQAFVQELSQGNPDAVEVVIQAVAAENIDKPALTLNYENLLGQAKISQSSEGNKSLQASRLFDPSSDTWLKDHCPTYVIPTMPFTFMLGMMEEAALALAPESKIVGFQNVRVSQWLSFAKGPQEVRTEAQLVTENGQPTQIKISLNRYRNAGKVNLSRFEPFCTGTILLGEIFHDTNETAHFTEEETIRGFTGTSLYEEGYRFHGPLFQIIDRMKLHPQNRVTTFLKNPATKSEKTTFLKSLFLDGVAQSLPHNESLDWSQQINGRHGFPFELVKGDFFGPFPTEPQIRCEVEYRCLKEHDRVAEFEVRIFSGDQKGAPLWARLIWNEVLVALEPLKPFSSQEIKHFLQGELPLKDFIFTRPLSSQDALINPKDIKACDWLPGTVARIYLNDSELEKYLPIPTEKALIWLAPRLVAKESLSRIHNIHPAKITVWEDKPNTLLAQIPNRPFTLFRFNYQFNGSEFRVRQNIEEKPMFNLIEEYWRKKIGEDHVAAPSLAWALTHKFAKELVFEDLENFQRYKDRSCLYLANHQTYLESFVFNILISPYKQQSTLIIAKKEHQATFFSHLNDLFIKGCGGGMESFLYFVNRKNPKEMLESQYGLQKVLNENKRSILIHVEGTRATSVNHQVKNLSGVLLDLAIQNKIPIVPVRFMGGVPLKDQGRKFDFPVGFGKQSIYVGKTITPETLNALPLAERISLVTNAINQLGGTQSEFPNDPDLSFENRVKSWIEFTGCQEGPAVTFQSFVDMSTVPYAPVIIRGNPKENMISAMIQTGLESQQSGKMLTLVLPDTTEGRWVGELAQMLYGSKGPKVAIGNSPEGNNETILKSGF